MTVRRSPVCLCVGQRRTPQILGLEGQSSRSQWYNMLDKGLYRHRHTSWDRFFWRSSILRKWHKSLLVTVSLNVFSCFLFLWASSLFSNKSGVELSTGHIVSSYGFSSFDFVFHSHILMDTTWIMCQTVRLPQFFFHVFHAERVAM